MSNNLAIVAILVVFCLLGVAYSLGYQHGHYAGEKKALAYLVEKVGQMTEDAPKEASDA